MPGCPVCSGDDFVTIASAERLELECRIREQFVAARLTRPANPDELKDLTDFFHTGKADVLGCRGCTLLVRRKHEQPPAQDYSQDEYDPRVMERLYPKYLDAFRKKANPYRALLPAQARVLEVGSHYGAFLETAAEWGWRAEGVDPGKDTSRFARSKGFTVHQIAIEECEFPPDTFDGVFIWNCFEQIEDPKSTLEICRRILKPGGLFTVRTPNGRFYSDCQQLLRDAEVQDEAREFLQRAMGYNNLLGFPYQYGHNPATLERLISAYGFRCQDFLNSELLVFPLPEDPAWVKREERAINSEIRLLANSNLADGTGTFTGPWVEVWFRAADAP